MLRSGPRTIYERCPGAASKPLPPDYRRHEPDKSVLYRVVQDNLATFLDNARAASADGSGVPRFVERELERYLACGILAHGFARVRCRTCGDDLLVALSCKGRGLCPSCGSRRMHDTALHLLDRVLPRVPMRQWVLSFPPRLRFCLAYDSKLFGEVLTRFIRALFNHQRRCARDLGLPTTRATTSGAVTFLQRLGSALQLTPHLHTLLPDGVFVADERDPDARPRLHRLEPPEGQEVVAILDQVATSVLDLLRKKGRLDDDELAPPDDALAPVLASSLPLPPHRRPGWAPIELDPDALVATRDGFSLHAGVSVHDNDREGLLRLCKYGLRPPLSLERLSEAGDGLLRYRLKRVFADGTREILLTPEELLRRLCAGIPRPRVHQTRYHGQLAPHAHGRAALCGRRPRAKQPCSTGASGAPEATEAHPSSPAPASPPVAPLASPPPVPGRDCVSAGEDLGAPPPEPDRPRRLPWADLLRRVHRVDVMTCARCGGPREVLAFITAPQVVVRILVHLGLPAEPPKRAPARAPPQLDLELGHDASPDAHFIDEPCGDV